MAAKRLYYTDAFLQRFSARVTAAREAPQGAWHIALDRSAFYPTSGGQPFDTGLLRLADRAVPVASVAEDDAGEVWHTLAEPLAPGASVEGEINWPRRLDHMQQHTGQHLLSAILVRQLHAPTVSFHLGPAISNIDVASPPLSPEQLEQVELEVNRIIAEDRPVAIRQVPRPEAEALLAAGSLRKLPDRPGAIRLIEIADCDLNACGGTHVRSTGQIGGLWLRGVEKISRGLRLHFACGLRAVAAGRADAAVLRSLTESLSVGSADLPAAVARLQSEAKTLSHTLRRLREELAELEASRLIASAPVANGLRLLAAAFPDRDPDYVRLLASRVASAAPATVAIFSSSGDPTVRVVLARSRDLAFHAGNVMKQLLAEFGLRGGGSPDLAQTELPSSAADSFRASLSTLIRSL